MTEQPFDIAMWNGGQRPRKTLSGHWLDLIRGVHTGRPAAALYVIEVADQLAALSDMEAAGYPVVLAPKDLPDGRKCAIISDPDRLQPKGDPIWHKVGNAFMGRRHGRKTRFRMANKYVHAQEFTDLETGRTPMLATGHIWPSVSLQKREVGNAVQNIASWAHHIAGTLIIGQDWNMEPGNPLMRPMNALQDLRCSQLQYGPSKTFGARAIDAFYYRESGHYRATGQTVLRLPGHEGTGAHASPGHAAVILHGYMRVRG